jgi:antitoxin component YwqK of YwqJK toxin-antitoxin module
MKNLFLFLALGFVFLSCKPKQIQVVEDVYDNGTPKVVIDYLVRGNDSIPLLEKQFHKDGSLLLQGKYINGLRQGEWLSWYPDGKIWSKGFFSKGKRTGKSWIYHPGGQLYIKGEYRDGQKIGAWFVFDENGSVIGENKYPE